MQPIVILGVGGFGREVHEMLEDINDESPTWDILGFLDGNTDIHGTDVHGIPVLGGNEWLDDHQGTAVAIGIGNPATKRRAVESLRAKGAVFPSLVHPGALVGRRVELGEGSIVCAGTIITTDVEIGSFVTLNIDITVGHDVQIQDYVTVAPGVHLSGNVVVGQGTDLGTGLTVIQGLQIGEWSVVGAGASVVRDLPANITAVGVPAKIIKERQAGWQLG